MTITIAAAAKDVMNDALVDLADAGAQPVLRIKTSGGTTLVDINLDATAAFGASAAGVAVCTGLPKTGIAVATGAATDFDLLDDPAGNVVFSGSVSVAGGGGDAIIDSVSIELNDTVQLNTFNVNAP